MLAGLWEPHLKCQLLKDSNQGWSKTLSNHSNSHYPETSLFVKEWKHELCMSESFTWVEPAAKGQSAVLLVKGKGINLQVTCWDHLDGFVVFYCSWAVDINIWDDWGFANMDTGEREEDIWCNESITRQNSFPGNKRSLWCGQGRCIYHVHTIHLWWHQAPRWHPRTAIFQWFHQTLQDPKRETHRSISETLE